MTREEAIKHGEEQLEIFGGKHAEFIRMAIEALKTQSPEKVVEAKPCPFCGGKAEIVTHEFIALNNSYGIKCKDCEAKSYQFFEAPEYALTAWNRRAYE